MTGSSKKMRIGGWTVEAARNLLKRDGRSVKLDPLTMDVLIYLANHAGEVVPAHELIEAAWHGRPVDEAQVYKTITKLRKAVDDHREDARFVETIPKRGYRLVAPVAPLPAERSIRAKAWKPVIAGLLVLALAVAVVRYVPEEERGDVLPNSVAVLPFANLSPNPDDAFFAAGLHEEILSQLSKFSALNIIARTSVAKYADSDKSIDRIAEELNVETVMEGSVRYADNRVLVTAQLIDPETNLHLWSDSYNRDFADVFAIQADIAVNIAKALEAEFSLAERQSIERLPTESSAAYALYLRSIIETVSPNVEYLDEAITLDPEFALAYATKAYALAYGLIGTAYALAYKLPGTAGQPNRLQELARSIRENADRALALDPTLGLAHAALAFVHMSSWYWAEAEQAFERALELSPNDPSLLVLYVRFNQYRGEYAEGIRVARRAVQLDPHNSILHFHLGVTYRLAKNHGAAAGALRESLNLLPAWANTHAQLAFVESARGNRAEALRELQIAEQLYDGRPGKWRGMSDWQMAQLADAYGHLDRHQDVVRLFNKLVERDKLRPVSQAVWALVYLALENYEEALQRLEAAVDNPTPSPDDLIPLGDIKANPYANPVLEQPRWWALRHRIAT